MRAAEFDFLVHCRRIGLDLLFYPVIKSCSDGKYDISEISRQSSDREIPAHNGCNPRMIAVILVGCHKGQVWMWEDLVLANFLYRQTEFNANSMTEHHYYNRDIELEK